MTFGLQDNVFASGYIVVVNFVSGSHHVEDIVFRFGDDGRSVRTVDGPWNHRYPDAAHGTHVWHGDVIALIAVFRVEFCPSVEQVFDGPADSAAVGNFFQVYISFTQGRFGSAYVVQLLVLAPRNKFQRVDIFRGLFHRKRLPEAYLFPIYVKFPILGGIAHFVEVRGEVRFLHFEKAVGTTIHIAEMKIHHSSTSADIILDAGRESQQAEEYREEFSHCS